MRVQRQGPAVNEQRVTYGIPFWRRLKWDLALAFVVLAVISIGIVMGFALARMGRQALEQLAVYLESIAETRMSQVGGWLDDAHSHMRLFLADPGREARLAVFADRSDLDEQTYQVEQVRLNEWLNVLVQEQRVFESLWVYDSSGRIVAAADAGLVGRQVNEQVYFEGSLNQAQVRPPYHSPVIGQMVMVLTRPLADETGRVTAVLAGRLDLGLLADLMADRTGLGGTGETYLVSKETRYLITPSRYEQEGYIAARAYRTEGILLALNGESGTRVYPSYRDSADLVVGAYRWVPELDAALLVEREQAEALQGVRRARNAAWLLAGAVTLVVALIGLGLSARVAGPIVALTRVAAQIADGDLDRRIRLGRRDEIGQLASVFNSMAEQLGDSINTLERRVAERTEALERRARYLAISAQVAREAALVTDSDLLLERLASLISDRFEFYHVGVFVLTDNAQWAVLIAASSPGGKRMLARQHRLRVGLQGIVGTVAGRGEPLVVQNVADDTAYFDNPDLPETRSEMALPLRTRTGVLGVLDVQSREAGAFDADDVEVLQTLADQVAIALNNARLVERTRAALEAERRAYAETSREAWAALLRSRPALGYRYIEGRVVSLDNEQSETRDIVREPGHDGAQLVLPVSIRDTVVGSIRAQKAAEAGPWTREERDLLDALVRQVSVALDGAQLYQAAQQRELRERLTRQIADEIRAAADIEQILQIATKALGRELDTPEVVIRLGTEARLVSTPTRPQL